MAEKRGLPTRKKTVKAQHVSKRSTRIRMSATHQAILRQVKLFATDVDGVLTDAGMYYGESGEELKKFHTRDGMGLKLIQEQGVVTAFITRENTKIVARRGKKLGIQEVFQGAIDKVLVLSQLSKKYNIPFGQMAYMGDDVNDVAALKRVGFSAAPADGIQEVCDAVHYVCEKKGGEGAVREVIDMILSAKKGKR